MPLKIGHLSKAVWEPLKRGRCRDRDVQSEAHAYLPDGRIVLVGGNLAAFNEPAVPILPEIAAPTGITGDTAIQSETRDRR